jgi:hypothetical protein
VPFHPVPFVINPAKNDRNHRIELEFIDELITPKSPARLRKKLKDPAFATSQKRRAQIEARLGIIITNNSQPGRSLSKGLDSRRQELRWIMLAHNLRGLARKRRREQAAREASQKKNQRVRKAPPKKAA